MNNFQLPPLSNEYIFEKLICDLFNATCKSGSYQIYRNKGNKQFGIDIFSIPEKTVIQCKKKELSRKDTDLQNELIRDLDDSMEKIKGLDFEYDRFILATTTKKYAKVEQKTIEYAQIMH